MSTRSPVVFLFDVDNSLVDNDRIAADLQGHLEREIGHDRQDRYWAIFEELREELGYADYLGALQRYRVEYPRDPHVLHDLDRFHLAGDVTDRIPQLGSTTAYTKQAIRDKLIEHREYIRKHGDDMPEVRDWTWTDA